MKIKIFVLLMCLVPALLKAQEEEVKNFQLGFTASPNFGFAKISGDNTSNSSADGAKFGFTYGLLGDFGFSKNYFFSTAFTVTSINAKVSTPTEDAVTGVEKTDRTYKIQYIEIPLTLKLKTNVSAGKSFYGQFGLGTGIKVRGRYDEELKSASAVKNSLKNQNLKDANVFRLGLVAGAGVQWDYNENAKFLTGITFSNGFTEVLDKGDSFRNSYLALSLGVLF